MMLWKNRNKKVGICVMVVTASLVLAALWAVLATPETTIAGRPPDNPGGNVVKQDIPGKLTLTGVALTSDDPPSPYSNSEAGTTCFIGRRRSIWVTLSKNSPRSMNLDLSSPSTIDPDNDPTLGADPWGVEVMTPAEVQALDLPSGAISQVELQIAPYLNVSGLEENDLLDASTWLLFLDGDNQWGLYFGPGRDEDGDGDQDDGWGGDRYFTDPYAETVKILCNTPNNSWTVTSTTPGYLWYKGSKKNAPWVYVGKYNVPWSCDVVESLE